MSQIYAPANTPGPAGPPATFLGPYNAGTTYTTGQAVSFNGSSYVSLANSNTGNQPDTSPTQWGLLAAAGAPGAPGVNGQVTNAALADAVGLMLATVGGGVNQLNPATLSLNTGINGANTFSGGGYTTVGFTVALGSRMLATMEMKGWSVVCFDINQAFIGYATAVGGGALPDPVVAGTVVQLLDGTAYVRFCCQQSIASTDMVVFGTAANPPTMPGTFQAFTQYQSNIVDANIAAAVAAATASLGASAGPQITAALPAGRNLYDVSARSDGYFLGLDGTLQGGGGYTPLSTSGYILVAGLGTIYCNGVTASQGGANSSVCFYDVHKNFLALSTGETTHPGDVSGFVPNAPIAVPAAAVYARIVTQDSGGSGYFGPVYVAPAGLMVMSAATPAAYMPFGWDLSPTVDSKIAAAVAAAQAAIQTEINSLGGGLGAVNENRAAQVAICENVAVAAGATQTLFSATGGPGSVERIQLAFTNDNPSANKVTEMQDCVLTISVDGTQYQSTVGMFFLNVGINDAVPAGEAFSTKWLERSVCLQQTYQGLGRRIYIPYQSSCSIAFTTPTAPMSLWTQVEYYSGAPAPGLHSVNEKVFHMATAEYNASSGLSPYQQIQLLTSAASGPGFLRHWHIAASCDARSIGNQAGWLEANPDIAFDGKHFGAGGTEDFFGTQFYGMNLQPKTDEFNFSLFTSAGSGLTYTLLGRHFDKFPLPFTTSLGPITWANGQGSEGVTPLPSLKCGMQVVWYTAS